MSDEAKVLAATVMRSLPSGAYHARRALAALESENAALQEELRKYQPGQGEGWPDDRHEFAGRLTALREVAERLQDERDSLIGDIADSWAPRIEALEEKNRQLELQRASALEEGRKRGKFNRSRNEESRTRLLQERAEKAEAALRELADALYDRRIYDNGIPQYEPTRNRKEVRLIHALNAARALSPTQETDPE